MSKVLSYEDVIYNLGDSITSSRLLTTEECKTLSDIKSGLKRKYKMFCWALNGPAGLSTNIERYNEFFSRHDTLRRRYIYTNIDRPISVVYPHEKMVFPIMDIRKESVEKQIALIENIASAEARELYNPQEDPIVKVRAFIVSDSQIVVLMKVYMHFGLPMSPFDMRRLIFYDYKIDSNSPFTLDEERIENANLELERKSFSYFRDVLENIGNPVKIPFSKQEDIDYSELYTVNCEIEGDIYKKLFEFTKSHNTYLETVFLRIFGVLFGEYSGTKRPLFAVRRSNTYMQIMPLIVDIDMDLKDCFSDIKNQDEGFLKHSNLSFENVMNGCGIETREYFDVVFNFQKENDENIKVSKILESISRSEINNFAPKLEITVSFSMSKVNITYTYASGSIEENMINMLQESLEKLMREYVFDTKTFSWKNYIEECKSQEEKIQKLFLAQKALYIKNGDFIRVEDPDKIITLAEKSNIGNYIVEDSIYETGKKISNLGVLVSGHVEERYINPDGLVKTVSVYKPGYVLLMEGLTNKEKSAFSYVAADDVKIIWIPCDILKEAINGDSQTYEAIICKAIEDTTRVKKLWVLD